jgi:hypothetical protein
MFQGRRVVVCVPSGRYRYMRILLSYLLAERHADIIDRIDLWVNTDVESDLTYFARMEQKHPKIKRVTASGQLNKAMYDARRDHYQYNDSIHRFYRPCVEPNTLYVKLDDDICYVHDAFFTNVFTAVIAREKLNFACVGNVLNIPYTSMLLQDRGTLTDKLGHSTGNPRCPFACTDGQFAADLHRQVLDLIDNGEVESVFFGSHHLEGRQRIGAMAWTGESFKQFGGEVGPRDEVELTTKIPETLLRPLWIVGDAVVVHLAFSHQRAYIEDMTNVLGKYLGLAVKLNGDVAG